MYSVNSQTMSESYKASNVPAQEWKFQITNGNTGEQLISDPLLDIYAAAEERAKSEFLKTAYQLREVRFSTHKTNFVKNQIVNVRGLPYIIKGISTVVTSTSVKTTLRVIRYD